MKKFVDKMLYGKPNKPEVLQSKTRAHCLFDIFKNNYRKIVRINHMLLLFSLPTIVWTLFYIFVIFDSEANMVQQIYCQIIYQAGMIPCLVFLSPALSGEAYVLRNIIQGKNAWVWSDFWQHTKGNAKQSVAYMLMLSVFLLLGGIALNAYYYMAIGQQNLLLSALRILSIILYAFVIMSSIYVFPMIVGYDLKLKVIIKNSFILCISRLFGTIAYVVLALLPMILLIILSIMIPSIGIFALGLYIIIIGLSFPLYVVLSYTTHVFDQITKNSNMDQKENTESENDTK